MARDFPRSRRVEEQIQRILSDVLRSGVRDPRLQEVIVTAVRVSKDLSVAWVYVTSLDLEHSGPALIEALNRAAGFFRSAVAAELTVRHAPEIRFRHDDSAQRAADMDELIERALGPDRNGQPPEEGS